MVTLNATLIVEVVLFLLFVWLMHRVVFRPLLRLLDARDAQLEEDRETAASEAEAAEALEQDYSAQVAAIHREASHTAYHAHRVAQDAHNKKVAELRKQEEEELAGVRAQAMEQVAEERKRYEELTQALAWNMADRLGLEGQGS